MNVMFSTWHVIFSLNNEESMRWREGKVESN
jgi:hypothetical protein